ncbi:MAG: hypothetical protein NT129_01830 [Candidatus Aenigmarchaeota archaeon]|nr:hypothetical protein [Candidatus Aenigmarchaeota archaeon]
MPEIYNFEIPRAEAKVEKIGGINKTTLRLFYPSNPKPIERRLHEQLAYGIKSLGNLISAKRDYHSVANSQNPLGPASAGALYIFEDGKFVCSRRDEGAPVHKFYHSAYAGFSKSDDHIRSEKGLIETSLRENNEECLLVTRDKKWLVVPKDSKHYTLGSALNLGLELKPWYVDVETIDPTDTLKVYEEDGTPIFTAKTFLDIMRESSTSINALYIRKFPFSSDEILPIDAEGMFKDGKYIHFNLEAYIVHPSEIEGRTGKDIMPFGFPLDNPNVQKVKIENSKPVFYRKDPEPYSGPDMVKVNHPHVWAPDNLLCRALDALGVLGYKNKWMEIELWKEKSKLNGESLLPDSVMKK